MAGIERIDQIDLSAEKAEHFDIATLFDFKADGVNVWELPAG
ncbi:MAG: hypothetical protein WCF17_07430 [Terracidiphilus sp.]